MMRSITFLQRFLADGTLGRMIKWIDDNHENAWSNALNESEAALMASKDFEEMHAVDAELTARQRELSQLYTQSDEYLTALDIEATYHLSELKDKLPLDPLGVIIHHIVHDRKFRERYYQ